MQHAVLCVCYVLGHSVTFDSYDPMDCSLPGSSVHGILQARVLEWVAISFPTQELNPGLIVGTLFTNWAMKEALCYSIVICCCFFKWRQRTYKRRELWLKPRKRSSLVVQWFRIACICMGYRFDPWSGKTPHARGHPSPWVAVTEPVL